MEWISVLNPPKEKEVVLVFCPKGNLGEPFQCVAFRIANRWYDSNFQNLFDTPQEVSHWMPLPEPPKP